MQETICKALKYDHLIDAKTALSDHIDKCVPDKIEKELLMENVVSKLGMFADRGRNYKNKEGIVKKDHQGIIRFLHTYERPRQMDMQLSSVTISNTHI